jgi:predicted ABC-type ATPase
VTSQKKNQVVIVAGANGSGKTTFAKKFLDVTNYEFLTYIFLGSETLCINRIKSRVRQGGHDVPEEDVIRRFKRGLLKFWDLYRLQVDLYSIYFNNEFYDFKQVAQGINDNVEILLQPLFDDFIQIIEDTKNG